jgi:hypothetical protein
MADWTVGTMLLQVYSLLVMVYDIFNLIYMVMRAGIEAFYHVFIPPRQKSVRREIVLVCYYIRSSSVHISTYT